MPSFDLAVPLPGGIQLERGHVHIEGALANARGSSTRTAPTRNHPNAQHSRVATQTVVRSHREILHRSWERIIHNLSQISNVERKSQTQKNPVAESVNTHPLSGCPVLEAGAVVTSRGGKGNLRDQTCSVSWPGCWTVCSVSENPSSSTLFRKRV